MQKKDRDRRDNAQRDENEERDPHANRNAVGNRVTTRWHSHESREHSSSFTVSIHRGQLDPRKVVTPFSVITLKS